MNSAMMRGFRRSLVLVATGVVMAGTTSGAAAQAPSGAVVQPFDSGARLRGYLTTLADNPQSLEALIGAGRAALEMGDANAALTFFGRADEVAPRHARVKAGMGSVLVHLGQPQAALSLFAEAVSLGAPEVEIAADRGLAYDLMGYTQRAQQEYVAAMRRREDPELRRRLALSLAISGERDAALRLIDPQLRRNDRAGRRAQAFILALTGDVAGANRTAQATMPYGGAQAMAPFFARLASLSPSQKAMAVHLGLFPNGGQARALAPVDVSPDPGAMALAMAGAPPAPAARPATTQPQRAASRRRPETRRDNRGGRDSSDRYGLRADTRIVRRAEPTATRPPERQPTRVAEVNTRWSGAPYPAQMQTRTASPPPPSVRVAPPPPPAPAQTIVAPQPLNPAVPTSTIVTTSIPASQPAQPAEGSLLTGAAANPPIVSVPAGTSVAISPPPAAVPDTAPGSLADIAALVEALPQDARAQSPSPPVERRAAPERTASTPASTPRATRSQAAPPANSSRHWVQIAGGIDRAALPREFARLRAKAPAQLGRRTAFTAPMRSTSRLLVGPFASAREAQDFVNQLAGHDVAAFAWTSAAGQEIERLQTGR